MFYKFDTNGIYCGTSEIEVAYSTSVSPPDENESAKWVWNHVSWVGLPHSWQPSHIPMEIVVEEIVPTVEPVAETTPAE